MLPIDLLWESNGVEDKECVEYMKAYPETVMNMAGVQK